MFRLSQFPRSKSLWLLGKELTTATILSFLITMIIMLFIPSRMDAPGDFVEEILLDSIMHTVM